MKKHTVNPASMMLALLMAFSFSSKAQSEIYQSSKDYLATMKVMANGIEKPNAWAGGQNSPQFAIADINKDGKDDLIIFENYKGVKTFLNVAHGSGTEYRYAPELEYKFPDVYNFIKMVDYNCDGVPDLFHFGYSGLWVCDGFYDDNNLITFKPMKEIRYQRQGTTGTSNVTISPSDNPGIEDIDHDGDLDVVSYSIWGTFITSWKNVKVEQNLPCDTFALELETTCWGKALQGVARTHQLGVTDCPPFRQPDPGQKIDDGNNAMCLVDIDGDGDFDFLDGNNQYSDIQLVINGKRQYGYSIDTMIQQDTTWQIGGHKLTMPKFPSAYWLDIDGDGDRDLLISPKLDGTENYKCIALYENQGTVNAPNFVYQTDTFLMEGMIDAGTNSYPAIYDYDKDGLQDLLIGTMGRYNATSGTTMSRIVYYKNTGTATVPEFTLQNDNLLNLESQGIDGGAITIGDLDNDGLDELLIGRKNGNIAYFRNNAANAATQPDWQLWQRELTNQAGTAIRANNFAAPLVYDVDKDGIKDLIVGTQIGYLQYYKNSAASGQIALNKQADSLGKLKVGPYQQVGTCTPFIGKIDNSGKEYLMMGANDGTIQRWEGIDSGDPNKTYTRLDTFYSNIHIKGRNVAPVFADLNNDGKYELFMGNDLGGINLYRQVWNVDVKDVAKAASKLSIYPNPAMDVLNVGMSDKIIPAKSTVRIYTSMGQLVSSTPMQYRDNAWRIDISALPAGMYLCSVYYNGATSTAMFSKTK
ncbi:MAG: T9SS type A sorting domain-containing protein [Sphingobacteriales bacterium]|nr:MAG: T9SS type A sorting domain-containing protein [Sphingobacteriales bacterium]